ncbi:MAG: hypothetical protein ABSE35_02705 [Bryobacteraceae bacterium]|jgi:hypothetical protein
MNKIRRRLVNFRVTDQEFERIKIASDCQGARCISEFARAVMLGGPKPGIASDSVDPIDFNDKLLAFDRRLAMLELYVSRLADALSDSNLARIRSGD